MNETLVSDSLRDRQAPSQARNSEATKGSKAQSPAMRRKRVSDILQPYREGVPLDPSVSVDDRIIHAIELMVNNNRKCIAVVKNQRPVGMVRLEDAFQKLGLRSWQGGRPEPLKLET